MDTLLAEGKQFSTSPEVSRAFWTGLYERVLDELGIRDEDGAHATYLYDEFSKPERYALFPDALPALRELTAHGYVLGIVSNFEGWLGGLLDRLGIAGLMKVVVVSGVEGIEKPDPRIFRLAMDRLGLAASRVVYVGDNPRIDLEPAVALGMGTVLLDRRGIHDGFRGTVVRSLEQVPAAIR